MTSLGLPLWNSFQICPRYPPWPYDVVGAPSSPTTGGMCGASPGGGSASGSGGPVTSLPGTGGGAAMGAPSAGGAASGTGHDSWGCGVMARVVGSHGDAIAT